MKRIIFAAAITAASSISMAGGFGLGASGFMGDGHGFAETATTGGSMAQGAVNGTGFSAQGTVNAGGGYAGAGANVTPDGVGTWSNGNSYAVNVSGGFTAGNANGTTAGAVGTDFSSNAWGNFHTVKIGGGFGSFLNF